MAPAKPSGAVLCWPIERNDVRQRLPIERQRGIGVFDHVGRTGHAGEARAELAADHRRRVGRERRDGGDNVCDLERRGVRRVVDLHGREVRRIIETREAAVARGRREEQVARISRWHEAVGERDMKRAAELHGAVGRLPPDGIGAPLDDASGERVDDRLRRLQLRRLPRVARARLLCRRHGL